MDEKKINMEDAFQVWWFIFWRTLLTLIGISIVLSVLIKLAGISESFKSFVSAASLIIAIIIQVFYIKAAINRNYKSFRLTAILPNSNQTYGEQSNQQ